MCVCVCVCIKNPFMFTVLETMCYSDRMCDSDNYLLSIFDCSLQSE